ncbi:hypothetical protein A4X13_0g7048 [Tilletia indica]|uniref:Uncharacterized protein n=1 Tax=Tilletia indica TaxID=43049 RepID=A0A8T8SMT8_9BASI|nr:hypothetical protein A4X13_0g7048 [Tilletia indica]
MYPRRHEVRWYTTTFERDHQQADRVSCVLVIPRSAVSGACVIGFTLSGPQLQRQDIDYTDESGEPQQRVVGLRLTISEERKLEALCTSASAGQWKLTPHLFGIPSSGLKLAGLWGRMQEDGSDAGIGRLWFIWGQVISTSSFKYRRGQNFEAGAYHTSLALGLAKNERAPEDQNESSECQADIYTFQPRATIPAKSKSTTILPSRRS